ncbi:hypothetical protein [Gaetbulibacter sp. S0825]|nr:hypothetical protein [Gaetbulibacter sp. S0825]
MIIVQHYHPLALWFYTSKPIIIGCINANEKMSKVFQQKGLNA